MKEKDQKSKPKGRKCYCDSTMLLIILSVISFGGLSYFLWFTTLYNDQLQKFLVIKNGSYLFKSWVRPPVSPLVCVHVFNYSNVDPFIKGYTDELEVNDVGPYCYRETTQKVAIQFHNNGTVSYRDNRTYKDVPEFSKGSPDDVLVIPNIPLFTAVAMTRDMNYIARAPLLSLLGNMELFSTVRAQEAFFGYKNTLMTLGNAYAVLTNKGSTHEKFGILLQRTGVSKDLLTVYTGENNSELTGQVYSVNNGVRHLSAWSTPECNAVTGSDGSRFPSAKVAAKAPVSIFSRDSCRPLPLVFHSEARFQGEIPTYRYTLDPNYFKSRTYSNVSCYCTDGSDCRYDGVFDISACAEGGAPLLLSQPHFLHGDAELLDQVLGLAPDEKKHDFFLDIHPKYGLTLGTVSRIQINIEVKKPTTTLLLPQIPGGKILPVFWMEISSNTMPREMLDKIYHATFSVHYVEVALKWMCLAFFIIASICFIRRTKNYLMR